MFRCMFQNAPFRYEVPHKCYQSTCGVEYIMHPEVIELGTYWNVRDYW